MNKRNCGLSLALICVFSVALLRAAENSDTSGKDTTEKTAASPRPAGKIVLPKDADNPYAVNRPRLIAVQDLEKQKTAGKRADAAASEQKSMPIALSTETLKGLKAKNDIQAPVKGDLSREPKPLESAESAAVPVKASVQTPSVVPPQTLPKTEAAPVKTGHLNLQKPDAKKGLPKTARVKKVSPVSAEEPPTIDEKKVLRQQKRSEARADKYLKTALVSYRAGEIDEAEKSLARSLAIVPDHKEALDLQGKITHIKTRSAEIRNDLAEQFYYRGESCYRDGNVLDALLFVQKSVRLNPEADKAKTLYQTLTASNQELVKTLKGGDKARFSEAVQCFLDEDFTAAAGVLRSLQPYYPQLSNMLAISETHCADQSNLQRSREYYSRALEDIRNERYLKAQEHLFLALEMDKNNLDAKLKLLQVNLELGMTRTSAVGQE